MNFIFFYLILKTVKIEYAKNILASKKDDDASKFFHFLFFQAKRAWHQGIVDIPLLGCGRVAMGTCLHYQTVGSLYVESQAFIVLSAHELLFLEKQEIEIEP